MSVIVGDCRNLSDFRAFKFAILLQREVGYMTINSIFSELTKLCSVLGSEVQRLEKEISKAPKGSLRISSSRGHPRMYFRENQSVRNGKYITNMKLAEALVQKEYDKTVLSELKKLLRILNVLISALKNSKLGSFTSGYSEFRKKMITENYLLMPDSEYAEKWLSRPFITKEFKPGDSEHYTQKELRVSSKSEARIGDMLDSMNIPYKYQARIKVGNCIYHPDFICLNVRTRREIIWEHCGKMDDPEYLEDFMRRIENYQKNGYVIGVDLILTFETLKMPMNSKIVLRTINNYLI